MGSRRTVWEKEQPREPSRHAWVYPTPASATPTQALVIEKANRDGEPWARIIYVEPFTKPPTVRDTWVPARVCTPVDSRPGEPNY